MSLKKNQSYSSGNVYVKTIKPSIIFSFQIKHFTWANKKYLLPIIDYIFIDYVFLHGKNVYLLCQLKVVSGQIVDKYICHTFGIRKQMIKSITTHHDG